MKKRIRTNRIRGRILISALIVVGLGIGISCSKDASVSSRTPTVATKPAFPASSSFDFHPQTDVNYDPFAGMTFEERKVAVGGPNGTIKYLQVIARHLANAMNDEKSRNTLHGAVPKVDNGEIHIAQLAIEYPHLLGTISNDFKDNISDKAIGAQLSQIIQNTESNGEAILKASKALLDLVVVLVTPDGQAWDPDQKIPVFYAPLNDDEGAVMEGVDAELKSVSYIIDGDKIPYPFLYLNFDEDSPMIRAGRESLSLKLYPENSWGGLWASWQKTLRSLSLTSPADAHASPGYHGPHYYLIQPVKTIRLYNDHEPITSPEIWLYIKIRVHPDVEIYHEEAFDLITVDEENVTYEDYAYRRATHGAAYSWNYNYVKEVWVIEEDGLLGHDLLGSWSDPTYLYFYQVGSSTALDTYNVSEGPGDAKVVVAKTNDTWEEEESR